MDIHKLALAKNGQVEFERQAEEQKQREALWDFVYSLSRIRLGFDKTSP